MAANIYELSIVAGSNSSVGGMNWAEGQDPGSVNDSARQFAALIAQLLADLGGALSAGGTANGLTVTANSAFTTLVDGRIIAFRATADNTGAATLNVNGIGAKSIRKMTTGGDSALTGNEIQNTGIYVAQYSAALNGAAGGWLLVNPTMGAPASRGYLFGLTLSNSLVDTLNDIAIAAGEAASSDVSPTLMTLASAITKGLDSNWVVGTDQGGLDTGAVSDTTYHVWLIKRSDTGVVDVLFSLEVASPTMPANYDLKRRIGSITRVAGVNTPFKQNGDRFRLVTPVLDVTVLNPGTSAVARTLLSLPIGIVVDADIVVMATNMTSNTFYVLMTALDETDSTPSQSQRTFTVGTVANAGMDTQAGMFLKTNASRQVRSRQSLSGASDVFQIRTFGWIDTRGRVA